MSLENALEGERELGHLRRAAHRAQAVLAGEELKLASAEQPPAHILEAIRQHRDDIVAHLKRVDAPLIPPRGSLVARLTVAGATVRSYGGKDGAKAEIEVPAGIAAELVREVEARGWRIIPGARANPEAVHDSWLAGVPIAEWDP